MKLAVAMPLMGLPFLLLGWTASSGDRHRDRGVRDRRDALGADVAGGRRRARACGHPRRVHGRFGGTWAVAWAVTPFLGLQVRHAYGDATMWDVGRRLFRRCSPACSASSRRAGARRHRRRHERAYLRRRQRDALDELTRVTNKHLLPVGRWPMVYYPLQLLQRIGVDEVLLVTGKQHAGQFIDLLGNGHVRARSRRRVLFDLDLTYKVQVEAGRDRAGRRHGARVRARRPARRVPRRQHLRARAGRRDRGWTDGALVFVKDVPDPENFGVVAYGEDGDVVDIVEKAGVVDMRYDAPPSSDAVVGLYCYPPDVFEIIDTLVAVEPRRARDHRRQPRPTRSAATSPCGASTAGGTTAASTGATSPTSAG